MSAGVLNQEQTKKEILHSNPTCFKFAGKIKETPDPSAIDLPIGDHYFEVPASCRPDTSQTITDILQVYNPKSRPIDSNKGTVLEPHKVYLIPAKWTRLELPPDICARCTARSSIGRLDVFVRLIADNQPLFDRLDLGQKANLFLEVIPLTFPIRIKPGLALSQIRFIKGLEKHCTVSPQVLKYERIIPLVRPGKSSTEILDSEDDGVFLSLDLTHDEVLGCPGFVTKRLSNGHSFEPIDLSIGGCDPKEYWEEVPPAKAQTVTLERERFYIFRSKERFVLPPHLAVECQAYSESLGDIRIHYAGFAHPYFGYEYKSGKWAPRANGTPLIFEVRGFSMDTMLRDGARLARVFFRRMSKDAIQPKPPKKGVDEKSKYNAQELKLSGYFNDWVN